MELIRTHHKQINEDANLIIFYESKILYDQKENSFIFKLKDLNSKLLNGPYLAIAEEENNYFYSLEISSSKKFLGIFILQSVFIEVLAKSSTIIFFKDSKFDELLDFSKIPVLTYSL